jgi:hypothetical protein
MSLWKGDDVLMFIVYHCTRIVNMWAGEVGEKRQHYVSVGWT